MIKKFRIEIPVIIFLYAMSGIISLVTLNPHIDERESHLPTVKNFYDNDILTAIEGDGYKSASTPLPYLIISAPLKIFSIEPSLAAARLLNIIISLTTLFLFALLLKAQVQNFIYAALILFFYPYFLKPSFAFFMAIYGLMFFLAFVYFIQKQTKGNVFISGLSLAAAVLCQQFYLIVFVFYAGFLIYKEFIIASGSKSILNLFYFLMPLTLPLILFLIWGGLVHPSYRAWGTGFSFSGPTGVLVTLGVVLLPYMAFNLKEISLKGGPIVLIISLLLVVFAYPVWVNQPTVGGISGITFNILSKINDFSSVLSFILKTSFCFMGMTSFVIFYKKVNNDRSRFLYLLYITLAIGFSLNRLPSERHMLPLIVVGYLFVFSQVNKTIVLRYWLGYSIIIGSVYFYYIMFGYG